MIEGLPGSGKTSLAEWLCSCLIKKGDRAVWFREEQKDHPVISRSTRQTASIPGYARRCAGQWRSFIDSILAHHPFGTYILEGCFFQSTVRFLLEYEHPAGEADAYLAETEAALGAVSACLIHLTQPDPDAYLRNDFLRRKGSSIVERIAFHTESTPYAQTRGISGLEALVRLYSEYALLCRRLLIQSNLPRIEINTVDHDESRVRSIALDLHTRSTF